MSISLPPATRQTYSCIRCYDRKIRCDRQNPCGGCAKHGDQCVFRAPPPRRKKMKRVRDDGLKDKLKQYEDLLKEAGLDPAKLPISPERSSVSATLAEAAASQPTTPASMTTELEQSISQLGILQNQDRSKVVENSLWSRVAQEFHDTEEALDDSSEESSSAESDDDDNGFIMGASPRSTRKYEHPSDEQIRQLWQAFIENVDPLLKVVHVPSLQPAIMKAVQDVDQVPRGFEALLFSIYAAAIVSLSEKECSRKLGQPKERILTHYIRATKWALARAKFMGTTSLIVLQAFVLHLFTVRNIYGPRTVWTLTGVAIRIAEGLGLHRDGAALGVPPFEAEMKRRIWWQLKMHDFRAAELGGLPKFRDWAPDEHMCRPPININDDQIYPGMTVAPSPSPNHITDMLFVVLRTELASFARRHAADFQKSKIDVAEWDIAVSRTKDQTLKDNFVKEIEDILESKYLRYCDPSQPLQFMTMLVARSAINTCRFLVHHPRGWAQYEQVPENEREIVWQSCIKVLELCDMLQSNRRLQGYMWHMAYFIQWHVIIHVLDTLRAGPLCSDAEKAWRLIESIYENNTDLMTNTKKPIHIAIGNLCLKAYSAYRSALEREGRCPLTDPDFITELRQQRVIAQARRRSRSSKSTGAESSQVPTPQNVSTLDPMHMIPQHNLANDVIHTTVPPPQPAKNGQANDNDLFWLNQSLDTNDFQAFFGDLMNLDDDFMLGQDFNTGEMNGQGVSWNQWDAWLGGSNAVPGTTGMGPEAVQ